MPIEDAERYADPLDQAGKAEDDHKTSHIDALRRLAEPEQVQHSDGSWPISECIECDSDLGKRKELGKIRCIPCQERLEKRRAGYGPG